MHPSRISLQHLCFQHFFLYKTDRQYKEKSAINRFARDSQNIILLSLFPFGLATSLSLFNSASFYSFSAFVTAQYMHNRYEPTDR